MHPHLGTNSVAIAFDSFQLQHQVVIAKALAAVERIGPLVAWLSTAHWRVQVEIAVAVVVGKGHAVRFAQVPQPGGFRRIDKGAVAPIAEKHIRLAPTHLRSAIAEVDIYPAVVIHIAGNAAHRAQRSP